MFCSDLGRAIQTAAIAFDGTDVPVLLDWRLRECDYGSLNGSSAAEMHAHRVERLDRPYPGGESWRQAADRVVRFLADLPLRWSGQRVLVIGHVATRWGLETALLGTPLEELVSRDSDSQAGWSFSATKPCYPW